MAAARITHAANTVATVETTVVTGFERKRPRCGQHNCNFTSSQMANNTWLSDRQPHISNSKQKQQQISVTPACLAQVATGGTYVAAEEASGHA